MAARVFIHESGARPVTENGMFQLGWPQFWLLSGIVAMLLALFGVILVMYLSV